jgi:hypothetical protein
MQHNVCQPITPRCPTTRRELGVEWHCPRAAGYGTDHPGTGQCRQHELETAAAARAAHRKIPQAVFIEPAYTDGLPFHETAPSLVLDEEGDLTSAW